MMKVMVQKWEESERGWGTRPDGFSLHATMEDLKKYVLKHQADLPEAIPDEYDRPCGTPYEAEVNGELEQRFLERKNPLGVRIQKHEYSGYPGTGGSDGWVTRK